MPSNTIQDIITGYPHFKDATESQAFITLCSQRIRGCEQKMSQDEIDALCYVLCSVSDYYFFRELADAVYAKVQTIGMTEKAYTLFVEENSKLITEDANRSMYMYGLNPDTPDLVNQVMRLRQLNVPVNQQIVLDLSADPVAGPEIAEEIKAIFDFLDEQLWKNPVNSIHELVVFCEDPWLLERFLEIKRNCGEQKTNYIVRIFDNLLEGEQNFPLEKHEEYTADLVKFMGILVKAIGPQRFQSQETKLTERFIASEALSLLKWLQTVFASQAPYCSGEASVVDVDVVMAGAGLPLNNYTLPQLVKLFGKFDYSPEDVKVMKPDVKEAILLSLPDNFEEQPKEYFREPKPEHLKNVFEQSEKGSSATIQKQQIIHEKHGVTPFEKSVPFPSVATRSDRFFKTIRAALFDFNPDTSASGNFLP